MAGLIRDSEMEKNTEVPTETEDQIDLDGSTTSHESDNKSSKQNMSEMLHLMQEQIEASNKLTSTLVSSLEKISTENQKIAKENQKLSTELVKITTTSLAEIRVLSEKIKEVDEPSLLTSTTINKQTSTPVSKRTHNTNTEMLTETFTETDKDSPQIGDLEQSLAKLNKTIENNLIENKNFKRDYKLTNKSIFETWLDSLNSELSSKKLLHVLTEADTYKDDNSEKTKREKNTVRDIIINHIDEKYHQKVLSLREPSEIISEIREIRRIETNMTDTNIRQKLYNLKKSKGEKMSVFWDKFENILRQFETCNPMKSIPTDEQRALFYHAVCDSCPELVTASLMKGQTGTEMTINEMKNFVLQLEAQKQETNPEAKTISVQRSKNKETVNKNIKCYRCTKSGHYSSDCPLVEYKVWFCYICNTIKDHKGDSCPNRTQRYDNTNTKNSFNTYNTNTQRGRGKGASRGNKRNFRDSKPYEKQGNKNNKKATANLTGKHTNTHSDDNYLKFIADSGATEHIMNKGLLLRDYKKSTNEEIRSANKIQSANIKIDGRGNIFLKINEDNKIMHLSNIIHAENVSDNLLSLRKFAEAGYGIYLDDTELRIFDKLTEENIVTGKYEKPNWLVQFEVQSTDREDNRYDNYEIKALLVSLEDFLSQSQTDTNISEENHPTPSEIGREKEQETSDENTRETMSSTEEVNIKRKILDLNNFISETEIEKLNLDLNREIPEKNKSKPSEGMLWHMRLGHISLEYMKRLQKQEEALKKVKLNNEITDCETCILAKMENLPFKNNRSRSNRPLHTVHVDTMGKITPASFPGENRFIIVFIDDYTRYARAYCVQHKSESGKCLERFLTHMRNLIGKNEKVCYIRGDNGTEFTGGEFAEIMKKEGISSDFAPPHTPELNGTAERFNKTIQMKIRALMIEAGLPETMWVLATEAAVHAYNRTPHKGLEFMTPLQKINSERKSHIEELKRFGCMAYVKVPLPEKKFSERAIKAILVGYTPTGYLLWQPQSQRFLNSRHVRFNEKVVYRDITGTSKQLEIQFDDITEGETKQDTETKDDQTPKITENKEIDQPKQVKSTKRKLTKEDQCGTDIRSNPKRRARENPVRDSNFVYRAQETEENSNITDDDEICYVRMAIINEDPTNYREALNSEYRDKWQEAIQEELKAMEDNQVWKIVDKPETASKGKKMNVIDSRWIFKRKGLNGQEKFKARLVIRGFKDKNNYELRETYAPVSRMSVIRSALAIINKYDLEVSQLDVKTAFLNGILEEEVYMEIPEGLNIDKERKMCKLRKTIYGLKISPKRWNMKFSEEVSKLGLQRDINEPCLFTWRKEGKVVMLVLYVDDILLAGNDTEKLQEVILKLCQVFEMKNLGEPKLFLGMKIQRDRKNKIMILNQPEYSEKILKRFNMEESKAQKTPMVTRQVKNKEEESKEKIQERETPCKAPYREAIGSLLYLAGTTRPDIAYAVNYLARKQIAPSEADWKEVKRIFRYIRGTTEMGLTYRESGEHLEAFTDASFRDCEESKSTGGYVIKLYENTVAWKSYKQVYTSLSTCQAEYIAMSEACQELISLEKAIRDITGKTNYPVKIWCDNKSAGKCTEMDGAHKLKSFDDDVNEIQRKIKEREFTGTKSHIAETHGDFVKSCVIENKVVVKWICSKENVADIMTKPLPAPTHVYLRDKILRTFREIN